MTLATGPREGQSPHETRPAEHSQRLQLDVSDGFESGDLSRGGWEREGDVSVGAAAAQSGSFGVRVGRGAKLTTRFDTLGVKDVVVSFDWRAVALDVFEAGVVEWAPPGGSFSELSRITRSAGWTSESFALPAAAEGKSGVQLRFRVAASGLFDLGWEGIEIDNVVVRGAPVCASDAQCEPRQVCAAGMCREHCADGVRNGDEVGLDCGGSCPACVPREELFREDFDAGLSRWTSSPPARVSTITGASAHASGPSAQLATVASMSTVVSTLGYDSLVLRYRRGTTRVTGAEALTVEVSLDGRTYTPLESVQAASLASPVELALPDSFADQPGITVQVRLDAGTLWLLFPDTAVVDEIVLQGRPIGGSCGGAGACDALSSACLLGACRDGACVAVPRAPGAPCGDASSSACDGADSCDGAGACVPNVAPTGSVCGDGRYCDLGTCVDCGASVSSTFDAIERRVFAAPRYGCASAVCHGEARGGDLSLGSSTSASHAELYGVPSDDASVPLLRVAPGDPEGSFLVRKLAGATRGEPVPAGLPMPSTGNPPITERELSGIEAWVAAGASASGFLEGSLALLCSPPCVSDADCDNGNACDGAETCDIATRECRPGSAPSCDDGAACTDDRCDPSLGCRNVVAEGLPCAGGVCDATGACVSCVPPTNTYDAIQTLVFDAPAHGCNVAGACHGSSPGQGDLDLRAAGSYAELFQPGRARVVPGDPAGSSLYDSLEAALLGTTPELSNIAMPFPGFPPLSPELLSGIETWIAAGAPRTGLVHGTETTLCVPPRPPAGDLALLWDFPSSDAITSKPLVVGDVVYTTSWNGQVYAIDRSTGQQRWSYDTGAALQGGVERAPDGTLYVADSQAVLHHLRPDGSVVRRIPLQRGSYGDHVWQTPTIYGGLVLVPIGSHWDTPCTKGRVMAIDQETGRVVWEHDSVPGGVCRTDTSVACTSSADCPSGGACEDALGGSITGRIEIDPDGQTLYYNTVGCYTFPSVGESDSIVKLDLKTGNKLWSHRVVAAEQFNYCTVSGVDCRNNADCGGQGLCVKKPRYHDFGFVNGPLVIDAQAPGGGTRRLVVGNGKEGTIYALDASTGAEVWRNEVLPAPVSPDFAGFGLFNGAMVYEDGMLYAALYELWGMSRPAPDHLMAFSELDGHVVWSDDIGISLSSLTIHDGVVYAGTEAATELYSYHAKTGARLGTFSLPQTSAGPGTVDDGQLFIGYGIYGAGGLHAYRIQASPAP